MIVESYSMGRSESQKPSFNETEIERLRALEGDHCVLYDGITWFVTVIIFSQSGFAFTLTPKDFIHNHRSQIGFFYYIDTGDLSFTAGDSGDLSFVQAFLNGYIPFELRRFRE